MVPLTFGIALQSCPVASQWSQVYVYRIGASPVHDPEVATSVEPGTGLPASTGGSVFAGPNRVFGRIGKVWFETP